MPAATPTNEVEIRAVLSAPRSSTYLAAKQNNGLKAVELYGWNARVSAAFMVPAHFAEISTRNAAADVLEKVYGPRWPWSSVFTQSLPNPRQAFSPRWNLQQTRQKHSTTGKVIADLKFMFWESLFTARHDARLWLPHIAGTFPHAPSIPATDLRLRVYNDLNVLRNLRNRIAHHEPVLQQNLVQDLKLTIDLIDLRSQSTAAWVRAMEEVTALVAQRP